MYFSPKKIKLNRQTLFLYLSFDVLLFLKMLDLLRISDAFPNVKEILQKKKFSSVQFYEKVLFDNISFSSILTTCLTPLPIFNISLLVCLSVYLFIFVCLFPFFLQTVLSSNHLWAIFSFVCLCVPLSATYILNNMLLVYFYLWNTGLKIVFSISVMKY